MWASLIFPFLAKLELAHVLITNHKRNVRDDFHFIDTEAMRD